MKQISFFSILVSLALAGAVFAEEVLSSRPVVISPRRIETETKVPEKAGKRSAKAKSAAEKAAPKKEPVVEVVAAEPEPAETAISIDEKNILMKVEFKAGSIQLSKPIRKQLIALALKPGQKIRISGFGEGGGKKGTRLGNLRARVVASFLNEAVGEIGATLQWSSKPHASIPEGAVIEALN